MKLARGKLRGEKVLYPDGVGICVWRPFDDDDDTGMCWDLSGDELDDAINLLLDLREAEAEVYVSKLSEGDGHPTQLPLKGLE